MACQTSSTPNFRALFEAAPGMYLVMTPGFEIVAASDAYLEATRRTRDELVGRTLFDVFFDDPDDSAATSVRKLTASVKRVLADKRADVMAIDREDRRCWKRVNSPILGASGEVIYIMHHVEDVTESKDDFLAMLGHELRNPLAAIASATDVLKRTGATTGTAGQSRAVIERQVRHLKRLVDDLVDAARVQGGKVTLDRRPIDLADAVHHAVSVLQGTGESKQHLVEVDAESVGVSVDPTRLEQILVNLLTNAVKFSPTGSTVSISARRDDSEVIVSVADEGPGIAPEEQKRIFDRFYQSQNGNRHARGTGIGLTIAQRFTAQHGGRIWVESEPNHGATFSFTLPVAMGELVGA